MGKSVFNDYETRLQEFVQQSDRHASYVHPGEEGPEHSKMFFVEVYVSGKLVAKGKGRSKKEAEQNAAMNALSVLRKNNGQI